MAQVTVSEACKLVNLSRSYFYKTYIHTGKVSVTRTAQGKPQIDTAELLRVFGEIGQNSGKTQDNNILTHEQDALKIQALQAEIEHLKARLHDKDERIADLKQTMQLLENTKTNKKSWFKFWG